MKRAYCYIAILAMMTLFAAHVWAESPPSSTTTPDAVWAWSSHCDGEQHLAVTVRIGSKVLNHSVVPVCQGIRDTEDGKIQFGFPQSLIFGGGSGNEKANIWQAGGEADALIIGFSLQGTGRIHLNTLHIAKPNKRVFSHLGYGLSMTTSPVPNSKH